MRLAMAGGVLGLAVVLVVRCLRPSPAFSLEAHWRHLFLQLAVPLGLFGATVALLDRRHLRVLAGVSAVALTVGAVLLHPVCVAIPIQELPAFESVVPLRERAARGEPFCNLNGAWYQCKSYLARNFFF